MAEIILDGREIAFKIRKQFAEKRKVEIDFGKCTSTTVSP
jgi:hypothetical protein